jgi:hypothetical protein
MQATVLAVSFRLAECMSAKTSSNAEHTESDGRQEQRTALLVSKPKTTSPLSTSDFCEQGLTTEAILAKKTNTGYSSHSLPLLPRSTALTTD